MMFPIGWVPFCRIRLGIMLIAFQFATHHLSFAQLQVFTPAAENELQLKSLLLQLEKKYFEEIAGLPADNKKDIVALYKQRWENVQEKFDKKEVYTEMAAQQYLDALVAEIVQANPMLQKLAIHCYFSRSGTPNASYIGEGVILFNMGLFTRLENESQAAFVLCHELAHLYLKHSENAIHNYVTTLNSKAVQQELKRIKSAEFKQREELEKLVKGITFNSRRHSRDHESDADSMAVALMQQTKFSTREALSALALLDDIDTDTLNVENSLRALFNAKDYPFKNKWLAKEEGLLGGHAQLDKDKPLEDSLKTHPDCATRIRVLQKLLSAYPAAHTTKPNDNLTFQQLKNTFAYEVVEYAFSNKNYTASLFYTLRLLQTYPSDPYLITQAGKIFNGFYLAQKTHTLSKVTALPSPQYPANYNLLLQFVQNLYREELASINYHFLKQYELQLAFYTPFKQEYNTSIQLAQQ